MYIDANTIITISAVLAALGGIGGVVVWCIKFVDRQKKQDKPSPFRRCIGICRMHARVSFRLAGCA